MLQSDHKCAHNLLIIVLEILIPNFGEFVLFQTFSIYPVQCRHVLHAMRSHIISVKHTCTLSVIESLLSW
jgi:hypothetical protein